ncbi:MAG: AraC family transcriptional regulator [Akkermansiaceae bacterium]|nr:AraC family transcriptional regulator [Akkermansiaceae bacterium]
MDALAAVVTLLKPQAIGAKIVRGSGRWGVRYAEFGQPSFALVLQGRCWLAVDGMAATTLETGDFVLFPAMPGFTLASDPETEAVAFSPTPAEEGVEELWHGDPAAEAGASLLGGYFAFDAVNASILLELLPGMLLIRAGEPAMSGVAPVVELIRREAREQRPGRSFVLTRLIEVMLVEALRSVQGGVEAGGLLAGLRDPQLAAALHGIHAQTARPWSLGALAEVAGMSRSSFAERFARVVGITPMNYLLQWRLAVARNLLASGRMSVAETALAVGYESASSFSTAFSREMGRPPKEFIGGGGGATVRR